MCILIIDDSKSDQKLLQLILRRHGMEDTHIADSPADAQDLFDTHVFDLILIDFMLPDINGIEACRIIRENDYYRDVPIIMITANDDDEVLQLAFDAGVTDYLLKPVKRVEFIARVKFALRLKTEIDARKAHEKELQEHTEFFLQAAREADQKAKSLERTALQDLVPVCKSCGTIRHQNGQWVTVKDFLRHFTKVNLSYCPDCHHNVVGTIATGVAATGAPE